MDITKAKVDVTEWLTSFVEKANPLLNGWAPCPYARAARLQGKISLDIGSDPGSDLQGLAENGLGQLDVVVKIYDPTIWPLTEFRDSWMSAQSDFLDPKGLLCLEDHPDASEIVNSVVMNQGTWALLLIQSKHKLEEAAKCLAARDYYRDWPEPYLESVFLNRQDPRA